MQIYLMFLYYFSAHGFKLCSKIAWNNDKFVNELREKMQKKYPMFYS